MLCQSVKGHDSVGQPSPYKRGKNQHEGGYQPQGHGNHHRHQSKDCGAEGPPQAQDKGATPLAFQRVEAPLRHQRNQGGRHQHSHQQQRKNDDQRGYQSHHHQRGYIRLGITPAQIGKPAPKTANHAPGVQPSTRQRDGSIPVPMAQPQCQGTHQQQRHQRQGNHTRMHAIHHGTPERIKQKGHGGKHTCSRIVPRQPPQARTKYKKAPTRQGTGPAAGHKGPA